MSLDWTRVVEIFSHEREALHRFASRWRACNVQPGSQLGHYEVVAPLGKGGMGEVWLARDTRLRRQVAVKTLPEAVSHDPERLGRLQREAELLANVNHPNIAAIYGIEEYAGTRFLVLEFVDGITLEDRIAYGPIAVEEALKLAVQIAEALEAAHGKDVIHRDLKPSNIKVTPDGRIKVLDFGLAKALERTAGEGTATKTVGVTRTGMVMGTPAYMSPEQARGERADAQSDIWAFGAVLYEMLSGVSPFAQKSTAETLARVLDARPDYSALPPDTPALVRRLVRRCLEKDPTRRRRHIGDVRIDIEEALAEPAVPLPLPFPAGLTPGRWLWAAGGAVVVALAGIAVWFSSAGAAGAPAASAIRVSIPFLEPPVGHPYGTSHLAISPDGSRIAYASRQRLWIREMASQDAVSIRTEPGAWGPFFSPDGEWVALFQDTGLVKVPVRGGNPAVIAKTSDRPAGGTWRGDGTIVFATSEGLFEVSAGGGVPQRLTSPNRERGELLYAWPDFVPNGQQVLFTIVSEDMAPQIALLDLATLEHTTIVKEGSSARYVPTGHLVYASVGTLKAVSFDAGAGRAHGNAITLAGIEVEAAADNGAASFSVADNGTLVFGRPAGQVRTTALQWIDRRGSVEPLPVHPELYNYPRISPDGTRVAIERFTAGNRDIWIVDLNRFTQTQLTDGPTEDMLGVWSLDSRRVFFASRRAGNFDIYSQAADGATEARLEFAGPEFQAPQSLTPDGRRLIVYERFQDVSLLDLERPDRLQPLLSSAFDERLAHVSPDGKWIVYESDESGNQFEIILRSFPDVNERREKLSLSGGRFPLWGPKGSNEVYYVSPDGGMMAASVTLSPTLTIGAVTKLFDWEKPPENRSGTPYDVSLIDGRFLTLKRAPSAAASVTNVSVVLNWLDELRRQLPR